MHEYLFAGRSGLVVEDEYLIADDLAQNLEGAGVKVLGPVPTVAKALSVIEGQSEIDVAVLDAKLDGELSWPVADAVAKRAVPILFFTGYDSHHFPSRLQHVARLGKPIDTAELVRISYRLLR